MQYLIDTARKVITLKGTYPIKEVLKEIKKIDGWEEYSLEQDVQTVPTYPYFPYYGNAIPCVISGHPDFTADFVVAQGEYTCPLPNQWTSFNTSN